LGGATATTPRIVGIGFPVGSDFQMMVTDASGLRAGSCASADGSNRHVLVSPSTSVKVIVPASVSTETTRTFVWFSGGAVEAARGDTLGCGRTGRPCLPGDGDGEIAADGVSVARAGRASAAERADATERTKTGTTGIFVMTRRV
jgi:hypothetical protein